MTYYELVSGDKYGLPSQFVVFSEMGEVVRN